MLCVAISQVGAKCPLDCSGTATYLGDFGLSLEWNVHGFSHREADPMFRRSLAIPFAVLVAMGCGQTDDKSQTINLRKQISDLETRISRIENDLETIAAQLDTKQRDSIDGVDVQMTGKLEAIRRRIPRDE
jgi:hypothetical protein